MTGESKQPGKTIRITPDVAGLEALFGLIAGKDPQAVIELKEGIIANFAARHLKPLAASDTIRKEVQRLTKTVEEAVTRELRDLVEVNGWHYTLKPDFRKAIRKAVDDEVGSQIAAVAVGAKAELMAKAEAELSAAIERAMRRMEERLDAAFEQTVSAAVAKRLQAIATRVASGESEG